jgi:hypothetical protein
MLLCCYTECHLREVSIVLSVENKPFMLSAVMLNVIMLIVFMLNVIILSVVMLNVVAPM